MKPYFRYSSIHHSFRHLRPRVVGTGIGFSVGASTGGIGVVTGRVVTGGPGVVTGSVVTGRTVGGRVVVTGAGGIPVVVTGGLVPSCEYAGIMLHSNTHTAAAATRYLTSAAMLILYHKVKTFI